MHFWLGLCTSVGIAALGLACVLALLWNAEGNLVSVFDNTILPIILFSITQAFYSAVLSIGLALAFSLSVFRLSQSRIFARFILPALLHVSSVMFVVPSTVVAHGILIVWGRGGLYTPLREALDIPLFGLSGVLLAHVFLNLPLGFRIIAPALLNISNGLQRQALLLNFSPFQWWRILAYPALKPHILGAFSLVFLLCFTSFALVLMMGGGPAATTLEVAIFEAVRFELDFALAALLSLIQLVLCGVFLLLLRHPVTWIEREVDKPRLPQPKRPNLSLIAITIFVLVLAFLIPPIAVVVTRGLGGESFGAVFIGWLSQDIFYQSLFFSLTLALGSALGNVLICIILIGAMHRSPFISTWMQFSGNLFLFIPTIVFGTGIFLLLRNLDYPSYTAPLIVLLSNILFTLPFSLRLIAPAMQQHAKAYQRQYDSLGLKGIKRLWWGDLRAHMHEFRFIASLSAAFSLGDFGVIALFNNDNFTTLPWLLYSLQGRYQSDQAAALAVWMLVLVLGIFFIGHKKSSSHA